MTALITSVNPTLFGEYGRQMVAGFEEFADADIRLIVVFEGSMPPDIGQYSKRCVFVPFISSEHQRFLKFFGRLYEAHGYKLREIHSPGTYAIRVERNYLFDAVRFSFKLFAVEIGRRLVVEGSSFAWIDADVRCLKPFARKDLEPFLPRVDELMSYLGRDRFPYSECGFLGFNVAHPRVEAYFARMRALYLTGEIFSLEQWHDSWLWDEVRREFERSGTKFRNVSGAASTTEHPFINTGLGEFFDHLKGPKRKALGRSHKEDYVVRQEPTR